MSAHYQAIEFKWIPVNWVLGYISTHRLMTAHGITFKEYINAEQQRIRSTF